MDIRSFFTRQPKSGASSSTSNGADKSSTAAKATTKKRKVIASSDDDDETPATTKQNSSPKPNLKKLKKSDPKSDAVESRGKPVVDVSAAFGGDDIVRIERPKSGRGKNALDAHFDDAFDDSLAEIDSSLLEENDASNEKTSKSKSTKSEAGAANGGGNTDDGRKKAKMESDDSAEQKDKSNGNSSSKIKDTNRKTIKLEKKNSSDEQNGSKDSTKETERKENQLRKENSSEKANGVNANKKTVKSESSDVNSPTSPKKSATSQKVANSPASSKKTKAVAEPKSQSRKRSANTSVDNLNESVLTDEDRFEKKRMAAVLYQQFKNRSGPANPGSKELPNGNPTCLSKRTFVITGVLDSMERDECADLIRAHGGKVTTSLSKKTDYMVVGEEAGLAKLGKAEDFGTKILSEDELLNLIRSKSGLAVVEAVAPIAEPPAVVKSEEVKKKPDAVVKKEKVSPKKLVEKVVKSEKTSPTKASASTSNGTNEHKDKHTASMESEPKSEDLPAHRVETDHERNIASVDNQAWVDKYKPTNVKQIIGQQGAASNVAKLTNWLTKWYVNQSGPKKAGRPNPWAKNDDGAFFKAALLSGPPGVGKTTTATLVARELGFDVVEFNASDTRSKRLLKEEVSELLSNKSLYGYFSGTKDAVTMKHVLLMDEVDGMAGNEDRGGMQELIALIRDSSVPVICMCNDRNHQKMRSLVNHCYDLRFARPQLGQIKGAMMSICFKESVKLAPGVLEEIIAATNNDIRQTLNHLTLMSADGAVAVASASSQTSSASSSGVSSAASELHSQKTAKKDLKLGPWEVVRKVFSADEHKSMSLADKCDLFFNDYSLGPLFVQQNYLQVMPRVAKAEIPGRVAMAADSLSRGDLIDSRIRSKMAWSLLPVQAMFSSVMPGEYMSGNFVGQINFPGWLGKYSKTTKRRRMAQEIHDHTRVRTSGSRLSVRLDYAGFLVDAIARPLRERGLEGVDEALAVMKEYQLLREDIESLLELSTWPGQKSAFDGVDGRVKAALTRAYNRDVAPYSYSAMAAVKKRKADAAPEDVEIDAYGEGGDGDGGDGAAESDEEATDTGVENDVMIKAKTKKTSSAASSSSSTTAAKKKTASAKAGSSTSGRSKATKSK